MLPKIATFLIISFHILVLNLAFLRTGLAQRVNTMRTTPLILHVATYIRPTPTVAQLVLPPLVTLTPTPVPSLSTFHLSPSATPVPWGSTQKVGEHLYRTYVGEDPVMATSDEIYVAINKYRAPHGAQELKVSGDLCTFADMRIKQLTDHGGLDSHKGFEDYLNVADNWKNLPHFKALGENNSAGYKQTATHLIEWVFDADVEHRDNQLNPKWNRVCARVSGTIVEILFGEE